MSALTAAKTNHQNTSSPQAFTPGQRITISGSAPAGARAGEWIAVESDALLSNIETNGIPTIRAQVLVDGTYQATATIRPGLKPDIYAIMRFHEGQPLDTTTWIEVRPYSSVTVRPRLASPAQLVAISGRAPRNACAGEWVTLKSHALSSRFTSDGVPSIRAQIREDGTYRVTATLLGGLDSTSYTVLGTYNRQPLDTVARVSVR